MPSEMELIRKAQNGERKAFEELALFYRKNVTGLAYRMTGRIEVAEEIAQEVFVRVYLALPRFSRTGKGPSEPGFLPSLPAFVSTIPAIYAGNP